MAYCNDLSEWPRSGIQKFLGLWDTGTQSTVILKEHRKCWFEKSVFETVRVGYTMDERNNVGVNIWIGMCVWRFYLVVMLPRRKVMTNPDSILKSRDITLPIKVHIVKAMVFPVVMYGCWELDYKESWVPKNWFFWTVVLDKALESPLDCEEIQSVHPKGNQFWIFIGRTDVEAETPILRPLDVKNWLIWKDPDAGKDWGWEEKGTTEDEMVGWHHRLNWHEFG